MRNAAMPQIAPAEATVRWSPPRTAEDPAAILPPMPTMLGRGLRGRCPVCGQGKLFNGFLSVAAACAECGTNFTRVRADDAPPYFTIVLTGHIVLPLMLWLERAATPPLWVHSAIFLPLTVGLALSLLRPIKGATLGGMLKLGILTPAS